MVGATVPLGLERILGEFVEVNYVVYFYMYQYMKMNVDQYIWEK